VAQGRKNALSGKICSTGAFRAKILRRRAACVGAGLCMCVSVYVCASERGRAFVCVCVYVCASEKGVSWKSVLGLGS